MRKAMGPILTTGVALVAAAVVVANPVVPPIRDMQISTTQLSTSPQALIPIDKSLLNSIQQQSEPFGSALAQILGALAAEADRIGNDVNSAAYAVAPEPAAAGVLLPPAYGPVEGFVETNGTPSPTAAAAATTGASTFISADVQLVVTSLVQDTTYLGNKVVEAAYAAVNVIVNTPNLIIKAVLALVQGDLASAVNVVVEAIKAFFSPGLILIDGLHDVVDNLTGARSTSAAPAAAAEPGTADATPAPAGIGGTGATAADPEPPAASVPASKNRDAKANRIGNRPAETDPAADTSAPADETAVADQPDTAPPRGSSTTATRTAAPVSADTARRTNKPSPRDPAATRPAPAAAKDQSAGGRGSAAGE